MGHSGTLLLFVGGRGCILNMHVPHIKLLFFQQVNGCDGGERDFGDFALDFMAGKKSNYHLKM